jgi:hypothetical protein
MMGLTAFGFPNSTLGSDCPCLEVRVSLGMVLQQASQAAIDPGERSQIRPASVAWLERIEIRG